MTGKMNKPKFKISKQQLLDFNTDCAEAVLNCPQARVSEAYCMDDRGILLGEVSKKQIFERWLDDDTLWDLGYHECLTEDAIEWIKKYKDFLAEKRLWKRANTITVVG